MGDAYEVEQGQITLQSLQLAAIPTITQGSSLNATGQANPYRDTHQTGYLQPAYREVKHA